MTAVYSYVIQTYITVGVANTPFVNVRSSDETSASISNVQRPNLCYVPQTSTTVNIQQGATSFAVLDNTTAPIHWTYVPQAILVANIKNEPVELLAGTTTTTLFLSSLVDPAAPEPTPVPQPEGRFYWG